MYDSLSHKNKLFFHPGFLGLKSICLRWLLTQIAISMSALNFFRIMLLKIFPFAVFLQLVGINQRNEVIGYAFIRIKKCMYEGSFLGNLGICVSEGCQGKGVGSKLMGRLIILARKENVKKIYLTTLTDNVTAIHLYEKYGFKKKRVIHGGDLCCGRRYDCIEMWLDLP